MKNTNSPLWRPTPEQIAGSNIARFIMHMRETGVAELTDSADLYRFSVDAPEAFWPALWDFLGVIGDKGSAPYLIDADKMPGARFFPAAGLNFSENLLLRGNGPSPALIFGCEDGTRRELSWDALRERVSQAQQTFKAMGLKQGDRVAAMMPNMPEAIIAFLAAASIGAVWSSCSPDFGVQGVLDRFGQIEPKLFVACEGYWFNGKKHSVADRIEEVLAKLPSVEKAILVPGLDGTTGTASRIESAVEWGAALDAFQPRDLDFERLPFDHPVYILFSSGTTGVPKCIVHSAGGALLQHMKEHQLHCDVRAGERLFYFTTCGWMMWNWLVSGLASGATLLLYEGAPMYDNAKRLFDFVEAESINVLGTSAKFIDALRNAGLRPCETHDLSSVRTICSTGSPLVAEGFDYVYENIKHDVHLASISGGTDIVSCFVLGNPTLPVWRGEVQAPGFGLAVDVFDDAGNPLKSGKGELVCTKPFPSMPVGFWDDPDGKKYHGAYFFRFENVWHHGDFAEWTEHGGMIIHGRSDATLNPGGVRIGTAEIYRQVEQLAEVSEAIVIGQDWDDDVRIVLFVVIGEGGVLDDDLRAHIKKRIREGASPRHVPAKIVQVSDIPRTKSGKITELAVRDVVHGREVKNKEALANPEALEFFKERPELAG
ncbi:MAG: acetoacetate--CoA ligase [Hyphomicrobiaceae bacterium]|nr:acetoacetate--CoA ligase [Hyphomicrobiaceae bacterium]